MADTKTKKTYYLGTGRRKTSVARVRLCEGSGQIVINGRGLEDYFTETKDRNAVTGPLEITEMRGRLDLFVKVQGGGITGQAGAVSLGLARALAQYNPDFEGKLRAENLMTRDARKVERKKYGRSGARRRFQFSKR